ncbi:MAG: hypothetical protein ABMB14_25300 [Myxococcota bacterium]
MRFVLFLGLVGCGSQRGGIAAPDDPFCSAAEDLSLVVARQCVGVISQPALDYPSNAQEEEAWLSWTFAEDQDTLVAVRDTCVAARPWADADLAAVDCETLKGCLEGGGVTFPDPWPQETYAGVASPCVDPTAAHNCGDGDVDCPTAQ